MIIDDDRPRAKPSSNVIGCDLSNLAVAELEERIGALQAEITRTQAEIDKKKAMAAAASAFFK